MCKYPSKQGVYGTTIKLIIFNGHKQQRKYILKRAKSLKTVKSATTQEGSHANVTWPLGGQKTTEDVVAGYLLLLCPLPSSAPYSAPSIGEGSKGDMLRVGYTLTNGRSECWDKWSPIFWALLLLHCTHTTKTCPHYLPPQTTCLPLLRSTVVVTKYIYC